jgi:hypothetical protein
VEIRIPVEKVAERWRKKAEGDGECWRKTRKKELIFLCGE